MVRIIFILISIFLVQHANGQDIYKRNMDAGYNNFEDEDFEDARYYFQKAVDTDPLDFRANYNLANAYFRLEEYDKSIDLYQSFVDMAPTNFDKARAYHNLGNAQMMNQKLKEAIESYKQGLRLNPSDESTRYNLAYAQELLKEQQKQQQQQNQDQNQDQNQEEKENDKGENSENDQNQNDQGDSGNDGNQDENKEGDENPQNNEDKSKNKGDKKQNNAGNQKRQLSKEEAEKILRNAYKSEKKLQEKIDKNKIIANGKPNKKDW